MGRNLFIGLLRRRSSSSRSEERVEESGKGLMIWILVLVEKCTCVIGIGRCELLYNNV